MMIVCSGQAIGPNRHRKIDSCSGTSPDVPGARVIYSVLCIVFGDMSLPWVGVQGKKKGSRVKNKKETGKVCETEVRVRMKFIFSFTQVMKFVRSTPYQNEKWRCSISSTPLQVRDA